MYFITPSKPGIFLIGVSKNRLYGFGENKNKKLCIYHRSIFDCGDWEEFFIIDINVGKAECCQNGLHVAAGFNEFKTVILIAAKESQIIRVFSLDILSKHFVTCKMLNEIYEEYKITNELNLCCNCVMAVIRPQYTRYFRILQCYIITPRRYNIETKIFLHKFFINSSYHCVLLNRRLHPLPLDALNSSNIAINHRREALFVNERTENGKIKTLTAKNREHQHFINIPDTTEWNDIMFCDDIYEAIFCVTRNQQNQYLSVYYIKFNASHSFFEDVCICHSSVDVNFPSFESSPFYLSYHFVNDFLKPDFIVFQASNKIITVPLRMLSLSELAYLTLRQLPEPLTSLSVAEISRFQWFLNIFRRKQKKVNEPWMSLRFIKKTMGLSKDFDLV